MLPTFTYHLPVGALLVAGGLLACFFGYRLFRVVLAIYGFILGALFVSSFFASSSGMTMLVAGIIGGLVGTLVFTLGYYVAVALLGALLLVLVAQPAWAHLAMVSAKVGVIFGLAVVGAFAALLGQRVVIIVGTAFGGAWTAVAGIMALAGVKAASQAIVLHGYRVAYPFDLVAGRGWSAVAWVLLGIVGTVVQFRSSHRKK